MGALPNYRLWIDSDKHIGTSLYRKGYSDTTPVKAIYAKKGMQTCGLHSFSISIILKVIIFLFIISAFILL